MPAMRWRLVPACLDTPALLASSPCCLSVLLPTWYCLATAYCTAFEHAVPPQAKAPGSDPERQALRRDDILGVAGAGASSSGGGNSSGGALAPGEVEFVLEADAVLRDLVCLVAFHSRVSGGCEARGCKVARAPCDWRPL